MKNYIRPIAEVSKFDVADIITVSGKVDAANYEEGTVEATLYNAYKEQSAIDAGAAAIFQW